VSARPYAFDILVARPFWVLGKKASLLLYCIPALALWNGTSDNRANAGNEHEAICFFYVFASELRCTEDESGTSESFGFLGVRAQELWNDYRFHCFTILL
jgi:hypothetical protein